MQKTYYGFVYITKNISNGKRYIGQRCLLKHGHEEYFGSGKAFLRAIKKHGRENFIREIVYYAETKESLDDAERSIIAAYDAVNSRDFYNLVPGGHGCSMGFTGKKHSDATREKMRQSALGHKVSDHTRKRVGETPKDWVKCVETRRANGNLLTGDRHPRAVAVRYKGTVYPTISAAVAESGDKWHYVRRHAERLNS